MSGTGTAGMVMTCAFESTGITCPCPTFSRLALARRSNTSSKDARLSYLLDEYTTKSSRQALQLGTSAYTILTNLNLTTCSGFWSHPSRSEGSEGS